MDLQLRKGVLLLGDVILLYATLGLALVIGYWGEMALSLFFEHAFAFSFLYLFWLAVLYILDIYDLSLPPTSVSYLTRFCFGLLTLFFIGVLFFYLFSFTVLTPKTNLFLHVLFFGFGALLWRYLFWKNISRLIPWRIGLYGLDKESEELKNSITSYKHHGFDCITLDCKNPLAEQIDRYALHAVIIPSTFLTQTDYIQLFYECLGKGITFLDLPDAYEIFSRKIPLSAIDQQWFIRHVHERQGFSIRMKSFFDTLVAFFLLIFSLPLWLLIALAIKIEDGGSVFYTQERMGKHRSIFLIRKFRTMSENAERDGARWALEGDKRITRVGRFLRRTHLDELPQLLNILQGDLSLVGPRPERPFFVEQLEKEIPHYHVRHFVKPGFTGWAQIKFRYARTVMDSRYKFEYDLYYIKNRSFILDALILLKTIQLFIRKNK